MAVDISQQAYQAIYQVIQKILGSREEAAGYAEDPQGYLAAEGIADYDLASVDLQQVVNQASNDADLPAATKQAIQQSYTAGGGGQYTAPPSSPAPGQPPADYLVQHVNHVTQVSYEGDDYITQQLINQENYDYSSNVNLEGNFAGDVDIDASSVIAQGDGALAADGDAFGNATADGAVAAGRDVQGAVNTGEFTGIQSGRDTEDANVNIGGGDQNVVEDSNLANTAVGGDVNNTNIHADDGAAVAFGEGAHATGEQTQTHTETDIHAQNSNVQTGDGYANQNLDQSQEQDIDQHVEQHVDAYNAEVLGQVGAAGDDLNQEQQEDDGLVL